MGDGFGGIIIIGMLILSVIGFISLFENNEITIVSDVKICVEERKPNFYHIKECKYSQPYYTIGKDSNITIKNLDYVNNSED